MKLTLSLHAHRLQTLCSARVHAGWCSIVRGSIALVRPGQSRQRGENAARQVVVAFAARSDALLGLSYSAATGSDWGSSLPPDARIERAEHDRLGLAASTTQIGQALQDVEPERRTEQRRRRADQPARDRRPRDRPEPADGQGLELEQRSLGIADLLEVRDQGGLLPQRRGLPRSASPAPRGLISAWL